MALRMFSSSQFFFSLLNEGENVFFFICVSLVYTNHCRGIIVYYTISFAGVITISSTSFNRVLIKIHLKEIRFHCNSYIHRPNSLIVGTIKRTFRDNVYLRAANKKGSRQSRARNRIVSVRIVSKWIGINGEQKIGSRGWRGCKRVKGGLENERRRGRGEETRRVGHYLSIAMKRWRPALDAGGSLFRLTLRAFFSLANTPVNITQ